MFEVDFAQGSAREVYVTPKGHTRVNNYLLFVDQKGVHIRGRKGIVYLTEDNTKVL